VLLGRQQEVLAFFRPDTLTTMRQIADSAEVSERTAYLAFPSKLIGGRSTRGLVACELCS
jgi:hypothetical protein